MQLQTINKSYISTYEIKKSKFIAHLIPISEFKGMQNRLREEHPKARHVVYALRYLNEFEQIVENSSDDGEPKGSSAQPSLNVLRGENMINVAVLIVRYFGGIKLGIGGLVRAYGNSVKEVISNSNTFFYEKMLKYTFHTSYSDIQKTEYLLNRLKVITIEREFLNSGVRWKIESTKEKIEKFKESLCKR
jgi:uncharacterized YigZ family protein